MDEVLRPADEQDDVNPAAIRETLERRGIVGGQVASPERAENDPFIQQVMADAERASASPEEAPNGTGEDPFPYAVGDTVRLQTVKKRPRGAIFLDKRRSRTGLPFLTFACQCMLNLTPYSLCGCAKKQLHILFHAINARNTEVLNQYLLHIGT